MRMSPLSTVVPVLFAIALSTAACSSSGSGSPLSPSTPSPSATASSAPASTTVDASQPAVSANEIELTARITAVGGDTITLGSLNLTIAVPSTVVITRGATVTSAADLVVGLLVDVKAVRNGATITAARVTIEDGAAGSGTGGEAGEDREVVGTLAARPTGTCPAVTFALGATTVTTTAATRFDDLACASLAIGDALRVEGVRQADGSVLASEVNRSTGAGSGDDSDDDDSDDSDDSDDDSDDDSRQEVDLTGALGARPAGSCPAVTFTLNGSTVVTSGTTRFDDVACTNLASGDVIRVQGLRQSNGSIAASEVKRTGGSSGGNSGSGSSGRGR